jgi:hypothetical protein
LFFLSFLLQFIVIGDTGTGKSCLLRYFIEKKCKPLLVFCFVFSLGKNHFFSFLVFFLL